VKKDKTSFIFGARTTYSDWLLSLLPEAYKHSSASFYDANLDISHQINEKNSGYLRYLWEQQNINETYPYNDNYAITFHDVHSLTRAMVLRMTISGTRPIVNCGKM